MSYLLKSLVVFGEEDNFETGCIPGTEFSDYEKIFKIFDNLSELITWIEKNYYFDGSSENWAVFSGENGRIEYSQMEDKDRSRLTATELEKFKLGKLRAWDVRYSFYIEEIDVRPISDLKLKELTGFQLI